MRAPAFWRDDGSAAHMLAPLGYVYDAIGRCRRAVATPTLVGVPVICVGNLVAGGAGKTPTAVAVAALLRQRGLVPHMLTRGYGGKIAGPERVQPGRHSAADVGDEALLLARMAPTWVARDRVAGAHAAIAAGADAIVMDDGLQNPYLHKDLSLVVVDDAYGFGNGRVHPAGPLREDLDRGLARADALLLIASDETEKAALPSLPAELLVLQANLVPSPQARRLQGRRAIAFAGIGRPERFFASLHALGVALIESHPFPDHHKFRGDEIMALVEAAHAANALLLTTAKDAVRLPAEARSMVLVVDVELTFADPAAVDRLLDPLLADRQCHG